MDKDPKYVVALDREITKEISQKSNKDNVVIYVRDSKNKDLLELLFRYQPFVYEYFPVNENIVETYFRKVRTDEVSAIRSDNTQDRQSLIKELGVLGIPLGGLGETTVMTEDIGHKILRSEFGFGPYDPHWRIALQHFETGDLIEQEMNKKLAERILFDPRYKGYMNLKLTPELMDRDKLEEFKDFMKYLV